MKNLIPGFKKGEIGYIDIIKARNKVFIKRNPDNIKTIFKYDAKSDEILDSRTKSFYHINNFAEAYIDSVIFDYINDYNNGEMEERKFNSVLYSYLYMIKNMEYYENDKEELVDAIVGIRKIINEKMKNKDYDINTIINEVILTTDINDLDSLEESKDILEYYEALGVVVDLHLRYLNLNIELLQKEEENKKRK